METNRSHSRYAPLPEQNVERLSLDDVDVVDVPLTPEESNDLFNRLVELQNAGKLFTRTS